LIEQPEILTQIASEMPAFGLLAWAVMRISGRLDKVTIEVTSLSERLAILLDRSRPSQGSDNAEI